MKVDPFFLFFSPNICLLKVVITEKIICKQIAVLERKVVFMERVVIVLEEEVIFEGKTILIIAYSLLIIGL